MGIEIHMRAYEKQLVGMLEELQVTEDVDGLDVVMRPVPDADQRHVLDPRILEVIKRKQELCERRASDGFRLSFERNRPDKVSFDLTTETLVCEERLVPIGGDHMIDLYSYAPADARENMPVLVYVHGGGFTAGDETLYRNQMRLIAEQSGALVLFPEYRLAPECPFPGAVEDITGVLYWVRNHAHELKGDPDRVMLAGDSAGGSIVCACLLDGGWPEVRELYLIYPASDKSDYRQQRAYTWSYDAYEVACEYAPYVHARIEKIRAAVESDPNGERSLYLQGRTDPRDPRVSAVFASDAQLVAFPPTVVVTAEYDYLRLGNEHLARRLNGAGRLKRAVRYEGCDHGFFDLLGICPQAEGLALDLARELRGLSCG